MGYRAEKEKTEKKKKLLKRILLGILLLCIAGLTIFSAIVPPVTWKYYVKLPKIGHRENGELRIHFIDVGQGDSTLIEFPDGQTMLIDSGTGTSASKKTMLRYLNALKIDEIDYLLITHADLDHCGSLYEVIKYKGVRTAFLPLCEPSEGSEYDRLHTILTTNGCVWAYGSSKIENLTTKDENFPFHLAFLYPYAKDVDDVLESGEFPSEDQGNYYSSVVYLEYGGVRTLFTGDIPQEIESRLKGTDENGLYENVGVRLRDLDVLKVAHHGSGSSNGTDFLSYVKPATAVISCGKDNPYGNPSDVVLGRLNDVGAKIYRTDVHGHVVVTITKDGDYTVKTV